MLQYDKILYIGIINKLATIMAKSKSKKATKEKQKGLEKKFLLIALIVTILLIGLIYMGYRSQF